MGRAGWGHPAFTRSCQFPEASCQNAGGVEAGSQYGVAKRNPGKRRKRSPTLEGLQQGVGIFAPPSGCVLINTQEPRVGAVAPTRGYRLQRLRRTGGRAGQGKYPPDMHPAPALAATRRTATAQGGAERNLGSSHPMTPRPNGAKGDHSHPVPCALSGHRGRCVAWSPGFTGSSQLPVASSQKFPRALTRRVVDLAGWGHPAFNLETGNSPYLALSSNCSRRSSRALRSPFSWRRSANRSSRALRAAFSWRRSATWVLSS